MQFVAERKSYWIAWIGYSEGFRCPPQSRLLDGGPPSGVGADRAKLRAQHFAPSVARALRSCAVAEYPSPGVAAGTTDAAVRNLTTHRQRRGSENLSEMSKI
jgi:hypothetical protein